MATPDDYESINSFEHTVPSYQSMFLPLMERNDVFIVSAIMKGLISTVIWVKPNWLDTSQFAMFAKSYVGVLKRNNTNELTTCSCFKPLQSNFDILEPKCFFLDSHGDDAELFDFKACKKIKAFKQIWLDEDSFKTTIKFQKVKNTIVDIDEDYFGVESGVKRFMEIGVSESIQNALDSILASTFCPKSIKAERLIDEHLRIFFASIASRYENSDELSSFQTKLSERTSQYFCTDYFTHSQVLKKLLDLSRALDKEEAVGLSKIRYCLKSSPRLKYAQIQFGVCHGTINPRDTINQLHVDKESEIEERGKRLTDIIDFVSNIIEPNIFTIARSLRDGYTPRNQQRLIEKIIIRSLTDVLKRKEKSPRVLYDDFLSFGPDGWPDMT